MVRLLVSFVSIERLTRRRARSPSTLRPSCMAAASPLLRLLGPLGALGIATFGLPQLATRSAAIYSTRGEHETLERSQSTLVALGVLLGAGAAALLLGIGWERFAGWFKVGPAERAAFSVGFAMTALLLPLLVPGFLLTAALSGIGHFRILRMTDVAAYLLYFIAS